MSPAVGYSTCCRVEAFYIWHYRFSRASLVHGDVQQFWNVCFCMLDIWHI